jgi:hypothetical protein
MDVAFRIVGRPHFFSQDKFSVSLTLLRERYSLATRKFFGELNVDSRSESLVCVGEVDHNFLGNSREASL